MLPVSGLFSKSRTKFGHRDVKRKISDCINNCVDLWNFTTEGYICLLACKLCEMSSLYDCPEDLECCDITKYVQKLSTKIVDTVWPTVDHNSIHRCTALAWMRHFRILKQLKLLPTGMMRIKQKILMMKMRMLMIFYLFQEIFCSLYCTICAKIMDLE